MLKALVLIIGLMFAAVPSFADESEETYTHLTNDNVKARHLLLNFGVVYASQWAFYVTSQAETIRTHGSLKNWREYPFSPRFDKDSFDFNIIKHSFAGELYYLFYRSRGYSETRALAWTFLSSVAFEFTIETMTERPSYQDLYQTPIYGTLLGMGFERLSMYFHAKRNWFARGLGYLLNPFSLAPGAAYNFKFLPVIDKDQSGAVVRMEF